ncbi:MAG: Pre-mRNA-splicing factor cef1 [Vezdaea aestivalis]|nr:MAG: Pre-mRNA-splicing factor cef1 [Vezdaea aestivalis]
MPVVKGGVWTNVEDEILKASVSKYGLNQWARVSSLLVRKTPKQCKARWAEWLDPGIRKLEWSKEEDERLLHLAKLMPTQWRTIAPRVGRTATQCLERYQKLLDEAEAKETDELGLGGPEGGETAAPSADDVRKLRPGELDPDPESKPARPDTIDLDEDEKEMLSEARARLANTQGKKAKRKARERQLEESARLAQLQKRRELKNAGINIKIVNRKKGQMDYNADIPFEKRAAPGFYDTQEEMTQNERQREAFDPRKQQLQNKRKGDPDEEAERKRQKQEKSGQPPGFAAAIKAGQMQRIREAEQSSKRRPLSLPAPQVGESELDDIVKMGNASGGTLGHHSTLNSATPLRTPMRTPMPQDDRIANEIRNIRALTETQSSLLGGVNTPLHQGNYEVPSYGGAGATPLLANAGGATPRLPQKGLKANGDLFASLPKAKEEDWEFELPEEREEPAQAKTKEVEEEEEPRDPRMDEYEPIEGPEPTLEMIFDHVNASMSAHASRCQDIEKSLSLKQGGYLQRANKLRAKIGEASAVIDKKQAELYALQNLAIAEEAAIPVRLEGLRAQLQIVARREREAQELYRERRDELASLTVNGSG